MTQLLDLDRVALILVEAVFFGDKDTIKRWSISRSTIYNYRQMLSSNPELAHKWTLKKAEFESNWARDIPSAIMAGVHFIQQAAQEADRKDPEAIHAVAGATKLLAEIGLTKELIDARLGRENRETSQSVLTISPTDTD